MPPAGFLFGPGSPGSGGRVPAILAEVPANVGNDDFKLGVGNARGGAAATLAVALQRAPIGEQINGVNINVDVHFTPALFGLVLGGASGVAGAGFGTLAVDLPMDPGLVGLVLFAQWFVWDDGVMAGAASTAGADVRFF